MDKTEIKTPESPKDVSECQLSVSIDEVIHEAAKSPQPTQDPQQAQTPKPQQQTQPQQAPKQAQATQSPKQAQTPKPQQQTQPQQAPKQAQTPQSPKQTKTPQPLQDPHLPEAEKLSDMEVMEHTESIWQYKEIVDNGTEMHSESHEKHLDSPLGEIIGARVRGKKHKHEGTNCDDYFELAATDDCIIAIVCDGAGSKPLSRIGSRLSCETAAAFLKEKLAELFKASPEIKQKLSADLKSEDFMAACGRIAPLVQESALVAFNAQNAELARLFEDENYEKALGRKPALSDLSATFLAAVAVPLEIDGKRQTFMACVQIGDGCICALDSSADSAGCLRLMGEADSGKFSGETDFLSEKNSKQEALGAKTRISRGSSDTILLMSDGVADDYFPNDPMMKRLYLDLCLNGIIPFRKAAEGGFRGEDPAPIRFRSVSLARQSIALQYAKQLLTDNSPEAVNALWDKRDALSCHSLEAFRMNIGDTPEERLRVWLDNYNERGSFDDRSLVLIRL